MYLLSIQDIAIGSHNISHSSRYLCRGWMQCLPRRKSYEYSHHPPQHGCAFFFFPIILYSSCIAYDKPSYLLDDFSCFPLCSRVDPLPYDPARYPDLNKPL